MPRQMTTAEAIAALGLSRRTIQRRVKDGTLATTFVAGHRLIIVPDEVLGEPKRATAQPRHEIGADAPAVPLAQFDALRAELDAVKSERDWLRQHVEQLAVLNTQLTARLLPGPPMGPQEPGTPTPPVDEQPRRRRRWPWQR